MRNSVPELPIGQLETSRIVEELCLALRDVGVRDHGLPNDERVISAIEKVQQLSFELRKREAVIQPRIAQLSQETSWQMEALLEECLAYPRVLPYVRERDGVRRTLRCMVCQKRELPDRNGLYLCDTCLLEAIKSIKEKVPLPNLLLLRIYNQSNWCKHADSETVMMAFDDYDSLGYAWCEECIKEEQARRKMLG
jgi:hypothetical protein